MNPPTDATGNRCPIVAHNMGIPSFAIQCEREAGHKGDHVSGGCIWADEDARIAPHHPEDVVLVYPPPGDGSAFRAAAKVVATVCNPPQCSSTCYDRAVSADTRCRHPEGHEGPHEDGAMSWEDAPAAAPGSLSIARPSDGSVQITIDAPDMQVMLFVEPDPSKSRFAVVRAGIPLGSGGFVEGDVDASELADVFALAATAAQSQADYAAVIANGSILPIDHEADTRAGRALEAHYAAQPSRKIATNEDAAFDRIAALEAEIAAMRHPFSLHIDPDGERVWRRGEQCRHERTYTAEATICRRCNKVI